MLLVVAILQPPDIWWSGDSWGPGRLLRSPSLKPNYLQFLISLVDIIKTAETAYCPLENTGHKKELFKNVFTWGTLCCVAFKK